MIIETEIKKLKDIKMYFLNLLFRLDVNAASDAKKLELISIIEDAITLIQKIIRDMEAYSRG